jgi:DNA polymerase I-like protein with 3'-5' exonuclease and polymerase domains
VQLEEAKRFINVFYGRYKEVAKWHTDFAATVERYAVNDVNEEGVRDKFRSYVHQTETGRRFYFAEYYNEDTWSTRMYNFSPTELKNYPVQGLATGDIVPMMLGVIFRKLRCLEYVRMVNTVHDSIMFDVRKEYQDVFVDQISGILMNTHAYFQETFKKPLALKLKAGASVGKNWFNMEELS